MRFKSLIDFRRMIGNVQSLLFSNFFSSSLSPLVFLLYSRATCVTTQFGPSRQQTLTLTLKTDVDISTSFCCCCFLWSCFELFFSFLPKNCISLGVIRPALEEIKPWAGYLQYRDHQHFLLASMSMGYQRITTYLNKTTTTKNFSTSLFCLNWVS